MRGMTTRSEATTHDVGDEVSGRFRCGSCDLLIESPKENDGILVLPLCPLCGHEQWRAVH